MLRTWSQAGSIRVFLLMLIFSMHIFPAVPAQESGRFQERPADPKALLRSARTICVNTRSSRMSGEALERELLKLPELSTWEISIVRKPEDADLWLEVTRKKWTTRFTLTLVDPHTRNLLAAAEASSLGGEIEPKLAAHFVRIIKAARN